MNRQVLGGISDAGPQVDRLARLEVARRSRVARIRRAKVFGPSIAREIPWDILLVLYTSDDRSKITVTSMQADVGAPMTTVLRWLKFLERQGFLVRKQHPTDRRIVHVALSVEGRIALDRYFETVLLADRSMA